MNWKNSPRAVMGVLLGIHILAHIDRNMLLGFSPQITQELGLSNAQYGFLVGAVWVLSFGVMALAMGSLADRHARTRVMAVGILIWSACTAASGAAHNFSELVAARFFVATGEAALVPAAVSLIAELFTERRRGSAMGIFFVGIPLGVGLSFLLAGTLGAKHGWRETFYTLGAIGVLIAFPMSLLQDRRVHHADNGEHHQPAGSHWQHVLAVWKVLRERPAVMQTMTGFVLAHMAFAGLSFVQLWLVRERGVDATSIAKQIGMVQIVFGVLGAVAGGMLSDSVSRHLPGGRAGFMALLVLLCSPLMIAFRFATPGTPLFYVGMCAGVFLPMALYGPATALIQGLTPTSMRSTMTGVSMMLINVFAIALGNLVAGAVSDHLAKAGTSNPLTLTLLGTDVLVLLAAFFFVLAARGPRGEQVQAWSGAH